MKQRASREDIHAFMAAVYPLCPDLAIAAFDERLVLQEATRAITELRSALIGILELGRKNTENEKYDGYYDAAKNAVGLETE